MCNDSGSVDACRTLPTSLCTPPTRSYKWAEVLSADAFGAFEEAGLEDEDAVRETGRRFADTVLALGGGRAPELVFAVRRRVGGWIGACARATLVAPA